MTSIIEKVKEGASRLPVRSQQALKRLHHTHQLKQGAFLTNEQEYALLAHWVRPGDVVLDVGANIGHYTAEMSKLVGAHGRVVAVEPLRHTFELLASVVAQLPNDNVTLINAAATTETTLLGMSTPKFDSGLTNYYMAQIEEGATEHTVMGFAIDSLAIMGPVSLIKMDVEGHEYQALCGMKELLARERPTLIVEGFETQVAEFLQQFDYTHTDLPGSSNRIYHQVEDATPGSPTDTD